MWLNRKRQARRYHVTERTIVRWENSPTLNYPAGMQINGQWYRREADLDAWDRARLVEASSVIAERREREAAAKAGAAA